MSGPKFLVVLLMGVFGGSAANAAQVTITGPVLSVYDDGFRVADDKAQPVRVDTWSLCGDRTREHLSRGDRITVEGDREWRFLYAANLTKADGSPACPKDAAPQ